MNVAVGCVTLRCTAVRTFDLQTTHVELRPSSALGSESRSSEISSVARFMDLSTNLWIFGATSLLWMDEGCKPLSVDFSLLSNGIRY